MSKFRRLSEWYYGAIEMIEFNSSMCILSNIDYNEYGSFDDGAWGDALPLVELICAAAEPLTVDAASGALGWDRARCKKVCDGVSLLFPLREGDMIGVLHKTVTDWLTGDGRQDLGR